MGERERERERGREGREKGRGREDMLLHECRIFDFKSRYSFTPLVYVK
jgi:hypothetical protein